MADQTRTSNHFCGPEIILGVTKAHIKRESSNNGIVENRYPPGKKPTDN